MATPELPDPELLRKLLDYDPDTGILTWRSRSLDLCKDQRAQRIWNTLFAGKQAFDRRLFGYSVGTLCGKSHRGHRVAWAVHYGEWPEGEIDHINGIRDDNRIANLRLATRTQNSKNLKRPANNTSGAVGVGWTGRKWRAHIKIGGVFHHLGHFDTKEGAVAARKAAEVKHGFHANHGR